MVDKTKIRTNLKPMIINLIGDFSETWSKLNGPIQLDGPGRLET